MYHQSWLLRRYEIMFRGGAAPSPSGFYLCLADSATLTASSPVADFFSTELTIGVNGYARQPVSFPTGAIFDNTEQGVITPIVSGVWTAVGSALQFQTVFLIADGGLTGSTNTIVAFYKEPQTRMRLPGQPYTAELSLVEKA
jgi:hypothetical protein